MTCKRAVLCLASLLTTLEASGAPGASGFQKPYFGATKPGTFARYTMSMPNFPDSKMTYTRLPDEGGKNRMQIEAEFTTEGQASTSWTDYTLKAGYSLEKDAISFGKAVVAMTIKAGGGQTVEMQPEVLENVRKSMSDYGSVSKFVGSETVAGKSCDRYKYAIKHPGNPVQLETGELWLNDSVPFGLVKQTGVTKEPSGKVISQFEIKLTESGAGSGAAAVGAPAARPAGPVKLADAFQKEQVELTVSILPEPRDGSRLRVTFKNKGDAVLHLVIPAGQDRARGGNARRHPDTAIARGEEARHRPERNVRARRPHPDRRLSGRQGPVRHLRLRGHGSLLRQRHDGPREVDELRPATRAVGPSRGK